MIKAVFASTATTASISTLALTRLAASCGAYTAKEKKECYLLSTLTTARLATDINSEHDKCQEVKHLYFHRAIYGTTSLRFT